MTTPTTLAGSVALMRYIAECQPLDVPNDGCGPVFWEGDENKVVGLMARVADYVEKHVT
jgi:hypothetical protein